MVIARQSVNDLMAHNCPRVKFLKEIGALVFALLVVAKSRTVGLNEATANPVQRTMSIYDLDVEHANMKNLPVQEIPLP